MTSDALPREGASDRGLLLTLNAFLLRPGLHPGHALSQGATADWSWYLFDADQPAESEFDTELFAASAPGDAWAAIAARPTGVPSWQQFVRDGLGIPGLTATGQSLSAVVFVAVQDTSGASPRWFAYTFGHAAMSILRQSVEPRFGLIVALNRIARSHDVSAAPTDRGRIRQAAYRVRGAFTYQAGVRAARDTPLESMRLNRVADLLSAAGGRTGTDDEPTQVFGSRSLRTRNRLGSLADLRALAETALADFSADDYRDEFGFVDHMIPVVHEATQDVLRSALFDDLVSDEDTVDVLLPDDLVQFEEERSIFYIVRPRQRTSAAADLVLTMQMVRSMVSSAGSPDGLDLALRFTDADRNVIAEASILDCLAADLTVDGIRYVLYDGDFYRVDHELLERVEASLRQVQVVDLGLPHYAGGPEGEWNADVAHSDPPDSRSSMARSFACRTRRHLSRVTFSIPRAASFTRSASRARRQ